MVKGKRIRHNEEDGEFSCEICIPMSYHKTEHALKVHKSHIHWLMTKRIRREDKEARKTCRFCGKLFTRTNYTMKHMAIC
jgi:hypothetical protein